jgi:uncharacterized damage-inducible protein DinB
MTNLKQIPRAKFQITASGFEFGLRDLELICDLFFVIWNFSQRCTICMRRIGMEQDLRYPIGPFKFEGPLSVSDRKMCLSQIAEAPLKLRDAIRGLTDDQIETPYRPGGWSVRQVVHHVPDSHLNSYMRFRLALTEDVPTIKPYMEDRWAELNDAKTAPAEISLSLLESLHRRWMVLLQSLSDADFQRAFRHPELGLVTLEKNVALYSWHGRHHTAHITSLRSRMGW